VLLDSIEVKYSGIEFDSLRMMVDHVISNEDSIKKYYEPDTLSLDIGIRMSECKSIRKDLHNIEVQKTNFADEIARTRMQLDNLKTDLSNGVLSEEKANEYVELEKDGFNSLNNSFDMFYLMQESAKRYYYSSVPIIDDFIIQLRVNAKTE
jgi:hypothetical protein